MKYVIPKSLKEEYHLFFSFSVMDFMTILIALAVFYLFSNFVSDALQIPYMIFSLIISLLLATPSSSTNPDKRPKRKWEAMILMLFKDQATYYSLNQAEEAADEQ